MEKIKKIDPVYMLVNILLPFVVVIATVALGVLIYDYVPEQVGLVLSIAGVGFFVLWWAYLGRKLYELRRENTKRLYPFCARLSSSKWSRCSCPWK